jgi:hypothetical protein
MSSLLISFYRLHCWLLDQVAEQVNVGSFSRHLSFVWGGHWPVNCSKRSSFGKLEVRIPILIGTNGLSIFVRRLLRFESFSSLQSYLQVNSSDYFVLGSFLDCVFGWESFMTSELIHKCLLVFSNGLFRVKSSIVMTKSERKLTKYNCLCLFHPSDSSSTKILYTKPLTRFETI